MNGKRIGQAGYILLAIFFCTLPTGCRRINEYLAEKAIANTRQKHAALLSQGGELFFKAAVVDSLSSGNTRYLLLLPCGHAERSLPDGYAEAGITPENSIVVHHRSDTTFHPSLSPYPTVSSNRLGLDFMHGDEIQLFSIRKTEGGYRIKHMSAQPDTD